MYGTSEKGNSVANKNMVFVQFVDYFYSTVGILGFGGEYSHYYKGNPDFASST
jgi:hypothetical protein